MAEKAGVRINGEDYFFVDAFKLGDPALVYEVTGLDWNTFSELFAKSGDGHPDPNIMTGLIAVAIQRGHSTWTRREVYDYVRELDFADLDYFGGEGKEDASVAVPPDGSGLTSSSSDGTSAAAPEESQSSLSLIDSGSPGSGTTTLESHQVA
jgi:hypothetical protein